MVTSHYRMKKKQQTLYIANDIQLIQCGNVASGKANFTLPPQLRVLPVSRRFRCCCKSSRRLLTCVQTAARKLKSGLTHTWLDVQQQDSVCPGVETLPHSNYIHTNIFSSARSPCEPGRRGGFDYFISCCWFFLFLFFYRRPRRFSHNPDFLPPFTLPPYVFLTERKDTDSLLLRRRRRLFQFSVQKLSCFVTICLALCFIQGQM